MLRTRTLILVVLLSFVAGIGVAMSPATAGSESSEAHPSRVASSKDDTSMAALNKGVPKATPSPRPHGAPVSPMASRPKGRAPIALTVQAPKPTTYGDAVQLTAVVNLARVAAGGKVKFLDKGVRVGSSPIDGSGIAQMLSKTFKAGKHSLTATYRVGDRRVSTPTAAKLTVAKRDLHLYAKPSRWSRPVGAKNPSYTVAIVPGNEGDLVNGDTLARAVSGEPTFVNSARRTSPASIYPITLSGLKSTNYNLVYKRAKFTVYSKDIVAGAAAPDLTLPDQNGANFSLSGLRGRVVLLDFSAGWCSPSTSLAHDIPTIASRLRQKGIPFSYLPVLVDGSDPGTPATQQNALNFFKSNHLPADTHVLHADGAQPAVGQPLPAWIDAFYGYSAVPADNNGNLSFPTLALIDESGVVRQVSGGYVGGIDGVVGAFEAMAPASGITLTSAVPPVTTKHDLSIGFTSTDPTHTECSVDDGPFAPCSSPFDVTGLAVGDHNVQLRIAGGPALEVDFSVIDLDTTITGGPGGGFIPAWDFTGTGVSFVCWTGSETPYHCESGWGVVDIPGGWQTFHVAAVDAYGNVDDTPATADHLFQPLPTVTLVPDKPNPTSADPVTWTVTVTDATSGDPVTGSVVFNGPQGASAEILLDGNGSASYQEPASSTGYDEFVLFEGDATHGARSAQTHVDVQ